MPFTSDEKKHLVKKFSNKSRKAALVANRIVAARVFDDKGVALTGDQGIENHYSFNLREAAFLVALREAKGDFDKAVADGNVDPAWAKRFLQRKNAQAFLKEDEHYASLAQIGSLAWTKGKIVAAVIGEENPTETQKWGLERLEKINSPKVSAQFNIQNNTFQMPQLPAEQQEEMRKFFDTIAEEPQAANG